MHIWRTGSSISYGWMETGSYIHLAFLSVSFIFFIVILYIIIIGRHPIFGVLQSDWILDWTRVPLFVWHGLVVLIFFICSFSVNLVFFFFFFFVNMLKSGREMRLRI